MRHRTARLNHQAASLLPNSGVHFLRLPDIRVTYTGQSWKDSVAQLERRIHSRFGERGLTKAVRDLGQLVVLVQTEEALSRLRLRRTILVVTVVSSSGVMPRGGRGA